MDEESRLKREGMDRIERLKALVEKIPHQPFPRYGLAVEYKNCSNHKKAIRVFNDLVERHPDYVPAYFHFAASLRALGQDKKAENILKEGITVAAKQGESHAREELEGALTELCRTSS